MNKQDRDPYLLKIIARHLPRQLDGQSARVIQLGSELMAWAQGCFVDLRDTGSHARQTSTDESSHVKLLLLLSNDCHRNAGGIRSCYESLYAYLIERYRYVRKHGKAIRLRINGMDIDVMPARIKVGHTDDHMLYCADEQRILETNLISHVDDALDAGRSNETRLMKIWFRQHEVRVPAIYMDYLVPDKLLARVKPEKDNLADNFMHMLRELARRDFNPLFEDLSDPANEDNLFSGLMPDDDKRKIVKAAQQAMMARNLPAIIG